MKILIGILSCIENELEECMASLENQTFQNWSSFLIQNKPNLEAHQELYKTFKSGAANYDLFLKLDADMVIQSPDFLQRISDHFTSNPDLDELQIPVYDHFTQREIFGQITYRNNVRWDNVERNILFTDYGAQSKKKEKNIVDFRGDIHHCPDPSDFQSWHFGLHKAIKFTQLDFPAKSYNYSAGLVHWDNIMHIFATAHGPKQGNMHSAALAGMMAALNSKLRARHIDYSNIESKKLFQSYKANPEIWRPTPLLAYLLNLSAERKRRSFGLALIYLTCTVRFFDLRLIKNGLNIALKNTL